MGCPKYKNYKVTLLKEVNKLRKELEKETLQ